MKEKGQRTRDGGIEDGKQRSKGHEKGDTGTVDIQVTEVGKQG
jgi:hypothetical protein